MKYMPKYKLYLESEEEIFNADSCWSAEKYSDNLYTAYRLESGGEYDEYTLEYVKEILTKIKIVDPYLTQDVIDYYNESYHAGTKDVFRLIFKYEPSYFLLANGGIMPKTVTFISTQDSGYDSVYIDKKSEETDGEWQFVEFLERDVTQFNDYLPIMSNNYGFSVVWLYLMMMKHQKVLEFMMPGVNTSAIQSSINFAASAFKHLFLKISEHKNLYQKLKTTLSGKMYTKDDTFIKFVISDTPLFKEYLENLKGADLIEAVKTYHKFFTPELIEKYKHLISGNKFGFFDTIKK